VPRLALLVGQATVTCASSPGGSRRCTEIVRRAYKLKGTLLRGGTIAGLLDAAEGAGRDTHSFVTADEARTAAILGAALPHARSSVSLNVVVAPREEAQNEDRHPRIVTEGVQLRAGTESINAGWSSVGFRSYRDA
jgi:hypothetical protein